MVDAGMLFGGDMTPESALTKLAYVLAKKEWDLPKKKRVSYNGYLTTSCTPAASDLFGTSLKSY